MTRKAIIYLEPPTKKVLSPSEYKKT